MSAWIQKLLWYSGGVITAVIVWWSWGQSQQDGGIIAFSHNGVKLSSDAKQINVIDRKDSTVWQTLPQSNEHSEKKNLVIPKNLIPYMMIQIVNPDGEISSYNLQRFGLSEPEANALASDLSGLKNEIQNLEEANSKLVSDEHGSYIEVLPFEKEGREIRKRLEERIKSAFTQFEDDRGALVTQQLLVVPEFDDSGVLGKRISIKETIHEGNLLQEFMIEPVGTAQIPIPTFISGYHNNVLARRRYGKLFAKYGEPK